MQIKWIVHYKQEIHIFNNRYSVREMEKPKSWCLLDHSTAEAVDKEVVFTVQVVVVSKELVKTR